MSRGRRERKGKNVLQKVGRAYRLIWETGFSGGSVVKKLPGKVGDTGPSALTPGLGRSPGGGNGNPLQYSCLENPMEREAWWTPWGGKESDTAEHTRTLAWLSELKVVNTVVAQYPWRTVSRNPSLNTKIHGCSSVCM